MEMLKIKDEMVVSRMTIVADDRARESIKGPDVEISRKGDRFCH